MRYAGVIQNDVVNGQGVCVSFWTQGCPHHCEGCFNPETWDFNGGYEAPSDLAERIVKAISANGIQRNFSVLGGEPLSPWNRKWVLEILESVLSSCPKTKIFLWTGYEMSELLTNTDTVVSSILNEIDVLVDGKFEKDKKDFSITLRGSCNQNIWEKNCGKWECVSNKYDKKN